MAQVFHISKARMGGFSTLLAAALVLGACVSTSIPVAPKAAVSNVTVAGLSQGKMIGAGGAQVTRGQAITVRGLSNAQGNDAKAQARQGCAAAGGQFNELALASYDQMNNAWVFIGACA